jgi:hypothetical protein
MRPHRNRHRNHFRHVPRPLGGRLHLQNTAVSLRHSLLTLTRLVEVACLPELALRVGAHRVLVGVFVGLLLAELGAARRLDRILAHFSELLGSPMHALDFLRVEGPEEVFLHLHFGREASDAHEPLRGGELVLDAPRLVLHRAEVLSRFQSLFEEVAGDLLRVEVFLPRVLRELGELGRGLFVGPG